MLTLAPMPYIEIEEMASGQRVSRIAGTRIRVAQVVMMHLKHGSSIDWIVENYDSLDYTKVYAALSYYYANQTSIESEIKTMQQADANLA